MKIQKFILTILLSCLSNFALAIPDGIPDSLDRGHRILLEKGFQYQALMFPYSYPSGESWSASRWAESNFGAPNTHETAAPQTFGAAPGRLWSRWMSWGDCTSTTNLQEHELSYVQNLVSLQAGDEHDLGSSTIVSQMQNIFAYWKDRYPDIIRYTSNHGAAGTSDSALRSYQQTAKPDMLNMFSYEFHDGEGIQGCTQHKWYRALGRYRMLGREGLDGTGDKPIPYSCFYQCYIQGGDRNMGISELSVCQYAPLLFGYQFTIAFFYNDPDGTGDLREQIFNSDGDTQPNNWFYRAATNNMRIKNLAPALVRLLSAKDYSYNIRGTYNNTPAYCAQWSSSVDPYITAISQNNPGTHNGGNDGEVWVGYFNPLHESFDGADYNDELYFMVLNGLAPVDGYADEAMQQITLNFNFGASGITNLLRLNRLTGLPEVVNLISDGGSVYHVTLEIDGGEADLFKFNDSAPFVGNVDAPENIFPTNSASVIAPVTLSATPFVSGLGYSFSASQWQISPNINFSTITWDSGETIARNYITTPANAIPAGAYYWRCKYKNSVGIWSDWSLTATTFNITLATQTGTTFEDNFNVTGSGNVNHNYDQTDRQSGNIAPILYNHANGPSTVTDLGSNAGKCNMNGSVSASYLSPNYNFTGAGDFSIEYEVTRLPGGNTAQWDVITFGTDASYKIPHEGNAHGMEIVFYEHGWYHVYDNNTAIANFNFPELHVDVNPTLKVKIVVSQDDFNGTGDAQVALFINGKPYPLQGIFDGSGTERYVHTSVGGFTNNYITFLTLNPTSANIDNFKISTPENSINTTVWTTDSDSGISSVDAKYSHAINLADAHSPIINGVAFTGSDTAQSGVNWEIKSADGTALTLLHICSLYSLNPLIAPEGKALASNVFYSTDNDHAGSLILSGLTPGQVYDFAFHSMAAEATGNRCSYIATSDGSAITLVDQDEFNSLNGQTLSYRYKAGSEGVFSVSTTPTNKAWFFYAFSNKLLAESFTKITNGNFSVTENISQCSAGGTNNPNVVGMMVWHNLTTGESGNFPAARNWIANNIRLAFGDNVVTISGTNIYGGETTDSITITRNASSGTIAYWRFEDGVNGTKHAGNQDSWYKDISGNGNDLSSWWDGAQPTATNDLAFSIVPQSQAENKLALYFDNGNDLGTFGAQTGGKMIENYMFNNGWTVECTFKLHTLTWDVIIGKDGDPRGASGAEATFWLKALDFNKKLECLFFDNSTNFHTVSTLLPIIPNHWYSVAATYDGSTARLYLKGESDENYILQGSVSAPGGATLGQWNENWSVGRGMWDGGATDFIDGIIDEVRISNRALNPDQFLAVDDITIPFVNLTNNNVTVDQAVTQYTIGGTNSSKVVGNMSWQNELSGGSGTLAASANWIISDIPIIIGNNVITVSGTNISGVISGDSILISKPIPEPIIFGLICLFALAFFRKFKS